MSTSVVLPALGESVTEGTVTRWLKQVGDTVQEDEGLLEISTDKVDTEIPSPAAGVLTKILVAEDETVDVGAELAVIGGDDAAEAAFSYGAACAAVYSLVSLLEQSMTVHRRRVAVEIDYAQEQSRVALDLRLRYRMWRFVRYLFFLLGNYLKKERKPS